MTVKEPIRVLIADDSAFARLVATKALNADPGIEVIGTAEDGQQAVALARKQKPDAMTLDFEMPLMDGLSALSRLMAEAPTPVVMLSAVRGAEGDLESQAVELGAVSFLSKAAIGRPDTTGVAPNLLAARVRAAAATTVRRSTRLTESKQMTVWRAAPRSARGGSLGKLVVIGSSTGGPKALVELFQAMPARLDAAVIVVQHMPPTFTSSLAERLDSAGALRVKEAEDGDGIRIGQALLAPGDWHLTVNADGTVSLDQGPRRSGVRPAIDITLESAAASFGSACMAVVLTGMGSDGTQGAGAVKNNGGLVAVEHESTCVVYGMPRSIVAAGLADAVVPLPEMIAEIASFAR